MTLLANSLFPIFAGLGLGYVAGRRRIVDNVNLKTLIVFLMSFALPCSLFSTIVRTSHGDLLAQRGTASTLAIAYLATYAAVYGLSRRQARHSVSDSAVLALTVGFPNATAVGLPLLGAAYGSSAVVACATAIAIGAMTISPITLALLENASGARHPSFARQLGAAAWKACRRPVVWAPLLGIVFVALRLTLPSYLERTLTLLGGATAGVALFLTGLVVSAQRFRLSPGVLAVVATKNLLQPALCLGVALLLHLSLDQTRFAVLVCAIPCGFFGLVFGKGFDATPRIASSSLIASYVTGIVTLAGWIVLLSHLA